MMQANSEYANTKADPADAARLEIRFQVAWMKAARTTRARGASSMRPPGLSGRSGSRRLLPWVFVPWVQPRPLGRGLRNARTGRGSFTPRGTLVATQSIGNSISAGRAVSSTDSGRESHLGSTSNFPDMLIRQSHLSGDHLQSGRVVGIAGHRLRHRGEIETQGGLSGAVSEPRQDRLRPVCLHARFGIEIVNLGMG